MFGTRQLFESCNISHEGSALQTKQYRLKRYDWTRMHATQRSSSSEVSSEEHLFESENILNCTSSVRFAGLSQDSGDGYLCNTMPSAGCQLCD